MRSVASVGFIAGHVGRCVLALAGGFLIVALPAGAAAPHGIVVWGCDTGCDVPAAASKGVKAISGGEFHSLALKTDGSVVAWGCSGVTNTDYGQCNVPAAASSGVTAVSAGEYHSIALKDGGVVAWGCGITGVSKCTVPAAAASGVTAIAAGGNFNLVLKQDGSVFAWGCGSLVNYGCDVPATAASGVTAIAANLFDSVALKDGGVLAWGCGGGNDWGQCTVPAAAASGVTAIAAGMAHTLALKQDGSVVAWGCQGSFDYGQCVVPSAAGSGVTAVAAGLEHSLALKQDGSVIAWGCQGHQGVACSPPAAASSRVTAIAAGYYHSLALLPDALAQVLSVTTHAPVAASYKQSFTVTAASSSGLPVAFSSSGACTGSGAVFTMTSATGTCSVKYDQPGDDVYDPAAQVIDSVTAQKASQTITFGALAKKTYGTHDFALAATASSGLAVAFTARGSCRVDSAEVHLTGAGSCTVTASQAGGENYNAAADVSRSFAIARRPCTVPNVVGKRLPSAKRAIIRSHCGIGKVRYATSRKKKGVVTSQNRRPGRLLPAGAKVDVAVSSGRKR